MNKHKKFTREWQRGKDSNSREKAVAVTQITWRAHNTPVNYSVMCFASAQHISRALPENKKKALLSQPLEANENRQELNPVIWVEMHYNMTSIHKQRICNAKPNHNSRPTPAYFRLKLETVRNTVVYNFSMH